MGREIRGANAVAYHSRDRELILSGPASCGKTFAILCKIVRYAREHKNAKILIVRKTRVSMNDTVLTTWEDEIYPKVLSAQRGLKKEQRKYYDFPNGSRIVIGGMDYPGKVLGSRWDLIYVNECNQLTEDEWLMLRGRLLAQNGPYNQIIGDCNPDEDGEEHWIWRRHQLKDLTLLFSEHRLNPTMRQEDLDNLKGLRGDLARRLYHGSWKAMPVGKHFKAEWFKYMDLRPAGGKWVRFWDLASGTGDNADYTVGVLMGWVNKQFVIADMVRGRWGSHERNEQMRLTAELDRQLVERSLKSSNPMELETYFERPFGLAGDVAHSIIEHLAGHSIRAVKPRGSKVMRVDPFAVQVEAGHVYLVVDQWNALFVRECCKFEGKEERNDIPDAGAGAFKMLVLGGADVETAKRSATAQKEEEIMKRASAGEIIQCTKIEYELFVRATLHTLAGRYADLGDAPRMAKVLEDVKRLDDQFAYRRAA